jgi:hypothetical protein
MTRALRRAALDDYNVIHDGEHRSPLSTLRSQLAQEVDHGAVDLGSTSCWVQ